MPPATIRALRRALLAWYDRQRRDLPWRRRASDPYAQWVAEIMLQQTRVDTVIPYYQRFMARFPTVHDLARADHQILLKHWEGLGYYRRALHLHAAAKLVSRRGGELPGTAEGLRELPGIGEYTSAAIASIALGQPIAAVDGNVSRVTARIFAIRGDNKSVPWKASTRLAANALIDSRRPGDFNQAMMDLGSGICTPRTPDCSACPLRGYCQAHQLGLTDSIPGRVVRAATKAQTILAVAIIRDGRLLMRRRPRGGLWSGLWELPCAELPHRASFSDVAASLLPKPDNGFQTFDSSTVSRRPIVVRHQLTHRDLTFRAHVIRIQSTGGTQDRRHEQPRDTAHRPRPNFTPATPPGRDHRWVTQAELEKLPVSTAHRKIVSRLTAGPGLFA